MAGQTNSSRTIQDGAEESRCAAAPQNNAVAETAAAFSAGAAESPALLSSGGRVKAIIATMATVFVVGSALGFGAPLIAALMKAHHFSSGVIGYNATMGGLGTVAGALLTPRITLRLGVVRTILLMLLAGSLSFLGFYYFTNIIVWFALRFALHFAMTVMFILSEFWVNSAAPPQRRAFILSIYSAAMGAGVTIGPIIFSLIGSRGGLPFAIGCLLTACAAIPVLLAHSVAPRFRESRRQPFLHHIFKRPSSTLAAFVFGAVQAGAVSLIAPFGVGAGYSESQAGQFLTVLALGNVLLLVPISILSDKSGKNGLVSWGCAFIGLGGALIVPFIIQHQLWLWLVLFILGGVSAGIYTLGLARLGASLRGSELASANSAFIFSYGMGMLLGPALTGFAMDYYPVSGFADSMGAFFGIYVVFILLLNLKRLFRS